jgi:mannose-6-phosphate isomerase-like protein (cupin superfamily)
MPDDLTSPAHRAVFVPPAGGDESADPIGYVQRTKATLVDTLNGYCLHEMMKPPGEGPPVHVHADMEEAFYVLEGEFTFTVGSDDVVAEAGAFVLVPRGAPHGFRNSGDSDGRYLRLFSPPPSADTLRLWSELGERIAKARSSNEGTTHELFAREVSRMQR